MSTSRPRSLAVALVLSLNAIFGTVAAVAAAGPAVPLPDTMAAVGDSITQAASTGGTLGADYPANSWSTGTSSAVNSHYLRLLATGAPISGRNYNFSVSGAKVGDLNAQVQNAAGVSPDYLTVLIGGNDLCTDTVAQMTSVNDFRARFATAMATLASASPSTNVYVVSIPNVYQLWNLFKGDWWARFIWSSAGICQSLLANPTSTQQADVDRREAVRQRNIAFNSVLAEVCSGYAPRCHFDGNAAFNTTYTASDVSGDYFHPSTAGQAKISSVAWDAGFQWTATAPTPTPMWLTSVSASTEPGKGNWRATVTVSVSDGAPVEGAAVSGSWSGGASAGCTTTASGSCSFTTTFNKKTASSTFSVTSVTKPGWVYDSTRNTALTSVTASRP